MTSVVGHLIRYSLLRSRLRKRARATEGGKENAPDAGAPVSTLEAWEAHAVYDREARGAVFLPFTRAAAPLPFRTMPPRVAPREALAHVPELNADQAMALAAVRRLLTREAEATNSGRLVQPPTSPRTLPAPVPIMDARAGGVALPQQPSPHPCQGLPLRPAAEGCFADATGRACCGLHRDGYLDANRQAVRKVLPPLQLAGSGGPVNERLPLPHAGKYRREATI